MAKPFIDPESTYGKLVAALAAHYSPDQLRAMTEAVETAIDDSYEWSKHSDPDDDRRDEEGQSLSKLSYLLFDARALQHARQVEEGEQAMSDDIVVRLRSERDEAIIHANNIVRESSSLITAKIPCGSCGGYWNAVDNFRRFESKTT